MNTTRWATPLLMVAGLFMLGCSTARPIPITLRKPGFFFTKMADDSGVGGVTVGRLMWADIDGGGFADCILDN